MTFFLDKVIKERKPSQKKYEMEITDTVSSLNVWILKAYEYNPILVDFKFSEGSTCLIYISNPHNS